MQAVVHNKIQTTVNAIDEYDTSLYIFKLFLLVLSYLLWENAKLFDIYLIYSC